MEPLKKIVYRTEEGLDKIVFRVKEQLKLFKPVIAYPYRGFGNPHEAWLMGRVLEKESLIHGEPVLRDDLWTHLRQAWKRYSSDEVPGVTVHGTLFGVRAEATTDGEGYFTLHFMGLPPEQSTSGWHPVSLRIGHLPFDVPFEETATGEVLIAGEEASFGVISDVDDTIMLSHAMHPVRRITTMLSGNAAKRIAFEGVEALYRALSQGGRNPLLFVSGSSYNLYDMLIEFARRNGVPKAPFILRDLGIGAEQWVKQDAMPYKKGNIERILRTYPDLPFLCIGDSGQEDPEIYAAVHRDHPGRIKAIYIRHVHTDARRRELDAVAAESDIPFLIVERSDEALRHAHAQGWTQADSMA